MCDSMADITVDDHHHTSDMSDPVEAVSSKEDAATTATRRELKQTSISEKGGYDGSSIGRADHDNTGGKTVAVDSTVATAPAPASAPSPAPAHNQVSGTATTPPADPDSVQGTDSGSDDSKKNVSSPKKKRAHDQVEEHRDGDRSEETDGVEATSDSAAVSSRTHRLEPEKKRPRDLPEDEVADAQRVRMDLSVPSSCPCQAADKAQSPSSLQPHSDTPEASTSVPCSTVVPTASDKKEHDSGGKLPTSLSAFAQSPFAKLANSTTSGFASLGATGTSSVFGSSALSMSSPFISSSALKPSAAAQPAPAMLSFGSAASTGSPFSSAGLNGTANSLGLGSVLGGGGFGGSLGPRLSSFASHTKPSESAKDGKSTKPFGAPDSDVEDDQEDGDEDGEEEKVEATEEEQQEKAREDVKLMVEDAKKPKLQKIVVDDGESGEATVLAIRAKMYQLENKEVGWKERGAGMLKLNIPKSAIEFDASGAAVLGTFDPSGLGDDDEAEPKTSKSVRLLMRQDHTLRLLLNTTVLPTSKFQLIPKLKAAHVVFTAFEANEVKQVQMKMSEANANLFMDQIQFIQGCLADV